MLSYMAVNLPVNSHSPDRQRDLWDNFIRSRSGGFVRSTYASENVQGPIFEEETAGRGSSCAGTEHGSDPITSYVTVVIFDAYHGLDSMEYQGNERANEPVSIERAACSAVRPESDSSILRVILGFVLFSSS